MLGETTKQKEKPIETKYDPTKPHRKIQNNQIFPIQTYLSYPSLLPLQTYLSYPNLRRVIRNR
jgi:hypothetical protein